MGLGKWKPFWWVLSCLFERSVHRHRARAEAAAQSSNSTCQFTQIANNF